MIFALVALLASVAAIINMIYVLQHWRRGRWKIRLIQALATGFVAVVVILDAGDVTSMGGVSGYLLVAGLGLVLTASIAEGIVDL